MTAPETSALLELTVRNHPSVFARLTALCSRRAYTIQGLCCLPAPDGPERRLWLLVHAHCAMEQIERQLLKLEDVRAVRRHGSDCVMPVQVTELVMG